MHQRTVLVSGAGIAGPAVAHWLDRFGFDVTVVERASTVRRSGQAVDFKGATHRAVLERMGIWDEVRRRRTGTTDTVLLDRSGRQRAVIPGEFSGGDVEILRGDLNQLLWERTADSCEYVFGDSITQLTETAHGVWVRFEHAPARGFDLVVGCDGIHSTVRRLAFGPERDYVRHLGRYYCLAGDAGGDGDSATGAGADSAGGGAAGPERGVSYAWSEPGLLAVRDGAKTPSSGRVRQMYMFASPELDDARADLATQRRIVTERFAGMGGAVPAMLAELSELGDFHLDSLGRVRMSEYTAGRIALVGDSGYGNTLGGFGTGLAIVGAYVLAGELAVARGDHLVAYRRYDEIMRRYAKLAGRSNAGRFLAPKTAWGIRARNRFLRSWAFDAMARYADTAADDIELRCYEEEVAGAR